MTTGLVRLDGKGWRGVGLGLLTHWESYERDGVRGVYLYFMGGQSESYIGKDAERIVAWLKEHSDLPIIAPGAGS